MKRISLWLVLLALTPGVSEAYGYGSYCGVRYTPYALTYRHSGLVSGYVDYTPYAYTYRKSGLVPGYGVCYGSSLDYGYPVIGKPFKRFPRTAFRPSRPIRRLAQNTAPSVRPPDGVDIIRQHLRAKGIASVNINRIFRIDNQLVSVDVLVKDRNLLIKYWNPQEIEALDTKEEIKQKI